MSTVSIMYTCALAVATPPHTTDALLTLRSLTIPVTVRFAPSTVLWVPTTCDGLTWPGTTWEVSRVGLEVGCRAGVDLGECVVGRREHGELAAVERVDEIHLRIQLSRNG